MFIHDDGSTDETLSIVSTYAEQYPEKLTLIVDGIKTGSAKANFSHLLGFTSAPYVMFADQDDVWLENKISATLNRMLTEEKTHKSSAIIVYTDLFVTDEKLNIISTSMFNYQRLDKSPATLQSILTSNQVTGCTMMVNRQCISTTTPIPEEAVMHDWWMACSALSAGGILSFIDEPLILYRQHSNNSVGAKSVNFMYFFNKLINLKHVFLSYKLMSKQARLIDPTASSVRLIRSKAYQILKRVLNNSL